MGPRSEERGNELSKKHKAKWIELQWGRAPRSAETGRPRPGGQSALRFNGAALRGARKPTRRSRRLGAARASMGPRSEERGNTAWRGWPSQRLNASMGPRSEERGNADDDWMEQHWNEASGPRSEERGNLRARARGAALHRASMGPRSEERGNSSSLSTMTSLARASMGPRSEERGNRTAAILAFWLAPRFNGAALRGARKQIDSRLPRAALVTLQWGRAPRSAETQRSKLAQARRRSFNGAALRGARKPGSATARFDSRKTASMGPRSEERGNTRGPCMTRHLPTCFNGAALRGARKPLP